MRSYKPLHRQIIKNSLSWVFDIPLEIEQFEEKDHFFDHVTMKIVNLFHFTGVHFDLALMAGFLLSNSLKKASNISSISFSSVSADCHHWRLMFRNVNIVNGDEDRHVLSFSRYALYEYTKKLTSNE